MSGDPAMPGGGGEPAGGLRRQIGLWSAVAIIVASMVGSGIFTTTGFLGHDLREPRLVFALWAAGGLLALAGAFTYGELGALIPRAGGEYIFLRAAFGPFVAFLGGWASFIYGFSAPTAICALAFMQYAAFFWPALSPASAGSQLIALPGGVGEVTVGSLAAAGLILVLTYTHYQRVAAGIRVQNALTVLKALAILGLLAAALFSGRAQPSFLAGGPGPAPDADLPALIATGLLFVSFAYSGWNSATYLGAELVEPARVLPRATLLGTFLVAALYVALNAAYLAAIPAAEMKASPTVAQDAAGVYFGTAGEGVIALVILIMQLGSISAFILEGSRVAYAMAVDGLAWRGLARLTGDASTPRQAVALQGGVAAILALAFDFSELLLFASAILMLSSALASVSLLVLRRRLAQERAWRAPLGAFFPLLYIAGSAAILVGARGKIFENWKHAGIVVLSLALAVPLYFISSGRSAPDDGEPLKKIMTGD